MQKRTDGPHTENWTAAAYAAIERYETKRLWMGLSAFLGLSVAVSLALAFCEGHGPPRSVEPVVHRLARAGVTGWKREEVDGGKRLIWRAHTPSAYYTLDEFGLTVDFAEGTPTSIFNEELAVATHSAIGPLLNDDATLAQFGNAFAHLVNDLPAAPKSIRNMKGYGMAFVAIRKQDGTVQVSVDWGDAPPKP